MKLYSLSFVLISTLLSTTIYGQVPPEPPKDKLPAKEFEKPYKEQNLCAFLSANAGGVTTNFWTCGLPYKQPYCGSDMSIKYDCCPGFRRSKELGDTCGETESAWKLIHNHLKDYGPSKFGEIVAKNNGQADFTDEKSQTAYTVFAPEQDSLMKLEDFDMSTATGSPHPVQMHIAKGRFYSRDLKNGAVIPVVSGNHKLKVTTYSNGLILVDCRAVTSPDHESKNGVIHYITGPILPHVGSGYQRNTVLKTLQNDPETNAFYSDIPADVRSMLDKESDNQWFTVFAPKNSVWNSAKSKFSGDIGQLVKNHILPKMICAEAITRKASSLGPTMANEYLGVDCPSANSRSIINGCGENVAISKRDLVAGNGVVQVIDGVLAPIAAMDAKQAASCQGSGNPNLKTSKFMNLAQSCDLKMDASSKYILLVPTDKAFAWLESDSKFKAMYDAVGDKCDVVRYHVLKADGANAECSTIVSQKLFKTTYSGPGNPQVVSQAVKYRYGTRQFFNNARTVHTKPHQMKNGYMFLVDRVMVPPTKTIMEVLSGRDDNSFVYGKLKETGYGSQLTSMGPGITFLAPLNHGFGTRKEKKYGSGEMSELLKLQTLKGALWAGDIGYYLRETYTTVNSIYKDGMELRLKRELNGNTYIGYDGLDTKLWGLVIEPNLPATDGMVWIVDWPLKFK